MVLARTGLVKSQRWGIKERAVPPNSPDKYQWGPTSTSESIPQQEEKKKDKKNHTHTHIRLGYVILLYPNLNRLSPTNTMGRPLLQ